MARSSRSVSLPSELWIQVDDFAKENNIDNNSIAVETLIKKGLEK